MQNGSRITFQGGAGSVTGANIVVESDGGRFAVDCGLEQRDDICDDINHGPFPYEPASLNALIVTHAHLDHIGRIPKLVRDGFRGEIHSTPATKDLSVLMFEDALSLMESHTACSPIYEKKDVDVALSNWKTHEYHEQFKLLPEANATLFDAGHILGSATALVENRDGKKILFTGDLGNSPEPILNDTEFPEGANYIVMESVYGDRLHEGRATRRERLRDIVERVRLEKRILLIPSFSIERTQILLHELNLMVEAKEIEPIPVFLDSPLAIQVTEVYQRYRELMNPAVQERIGSGDDPFAFDGLTLTPKRAQSDEIERAPAPKVIIAGAGMSHGGRIRQHELRHLGNPHATILFVGYQTPGSLGRRILDGEKTVQINGTWVRVHAEIESIFGYSGHRDRDGLMEFAEKTGAHTQKVFVIMGEPKASLFLAQRLHDFLGFDACVPELGESFPIEW